MQVPDLLPDTVAANIVLAHCIECWIFHKKTAPADKDRVCRATGAHSTLYTIFHIFRLEHGAPALEAERSCSGLTAAHSWGRLVLSFLALPSEQTVDGIEECRLGPIVAYVE